MVSVVKDMWSEDNPDADLPAFYYADQLAKYNITRGNNAGYGKDAAAPVTAAVMRAALNNIKQVGFKGCLE